MVYSTKTWNCVSFVQSLNRWTFVLFYILFTIWRKLKWMWIAGQRMSPGSSIAKATDFRLCQNLSEHAAMARIISASFSDIEVSNWKKTAHLIYFTVEQSFCFLLWNAQYRKNGTSFRYASFLVWLFTHFSLLFVTPIILPTIVLCSEFDERVRRSNACYRIQILLTHRMSSGKKLNDVKPWK